jgi:putative hydroxymethylpyrimidine transport system substrate-binding protein
MRLCWWGCCLAIFVALVGCGGGETSDPATRSSEAPTATTAAKKEPEVPEIFRDRGPLKCPRRSKIVSVTLDADPSPQNAGVVMAQSEGFFTDVGLEVSVGGPKNSARAVRYVSTGIDAIGVVQQPQVVLAGEEGGPPLLGIGRLIGQSNGALIWLPRSGIHDVADLEGKTIGLPGVPFQEAFLAEVLAGAGLTLDDVTIKRTNYKSADALTEGRVDAIFGGTWNIEGAALEAQGAEPVIKRAQDLGLPPYEELVVIAPAKCVKKSPRLFRDFMVAVAKGTEVVLEHPAKALELTAQNYELDPRFHRSDLRAQFAATLPLLSRDFQMNLPQAADLISWMKEKGMVEESPPAAQLFSNDYLPKP